MPDKPLAEVEEIQPKYLSEMLLHTPSLALDAARHEIKRMGKRVDLMNSAMMPAVLTGNKESLLAVREMDEEVDVFHKHLVNYLAKVSKLKLNEYQTQKMMKLMDAVNDLDHIGDLIEVNLVGLGERRIEKGFKISEATQKVINTVYQIVFRCAESRRACGCRRRQRICHASDIDEVRYEPSGSAGRHASGSAAHFRRFRKIRGLQRGSGHYRKAQTDLLSRQTHGQNSG